jgi:hypothetical protein
LQGGCGVTVVVGWSQGGCTHVPGSLQGRSRQAARRERMQAKEPNSEAAARVTASSSRPREALPKRAVTPAGLEAASGSDRSAGTSSARMAEPPRKAASSHSAADASPQKHPLEKSLPKPKATAKTSALTRNMSTLGSGVLGPTMPGGSALTTTASLGASDGEESDEGSERSSTGSTQSTASKRVPPREMEISPEFKLIVSRPNARSGQVRSGLLLGRSLGP